MIILCVRVFETSARTVIFLLSKSMSEASRNGFILPDSNSSGRMPAKAIRAYSGLYSGAQAARFSRVCATDMILMGDLSFKILWILTFQKTLVAAKFDATSQDQKARSEDLTCDLFLEISI